MRSSALVSLAKKIIRGAVGTGLEEAGSRICGATAWKFTKKVLSPVVSELEKKFPKMFLVPEEAEKAAEDLSADQQLQDLLEEGFSELEAGQEEILAAIARQNDTLQAIGTSVDEGFRKAGDKIDRAHEQLAKEIETIKLRLDLLIDSGEKAPLPPDDSARLSPEQISDQAYAYQADAIRWVVAGDAATAGQRLAQGRALVEGALQFHPGNSDLFVALGYVEKTEAQAAQLRRDHVGYVSGLEKAAVCFASVLKQKPRDVGALNGMANVYYYHLDYQRAIELGTLAVNSVPEYGAAWWDLALSYEGKISEVGPHEVLLGELERIYITLEMIMPEQPAVFTAADLAYVQKKIKSIARMRED